MGAPSEFTTATPSGYCLQPSAIALAAKSANSADGARGTLGHGAGVAGITCGVVGRIPPFAPLPPSPDSRSPAANTVVVEKRITAIPTSVEGVPFMINLASVA